MRAEGVRHRLTATAVALAVLGAGSGAGAQLAKPNYLPFAEFTARDTQAQIDLKKAYNDAVERYNQVLYDYYAALEQHDRLVDTYNASTDPPERQRARDDAVPLRAKLNGLRRDAASLFTAIDQAARRAVAGGATVRP